MRILKTSSWYLPLAILSLGSTARLDIALAQGRQELDTLKAEISRLYQEGRFNEGLEVTKRAVLLAQQNAARDPVTLAHVLNSLGLIVFEPGRICDGRAGL